MRPIFLRTALLFTLTSSSSSQFLPVSLSHRQPPGCQFPSATEGAYIYFNHPDDPHQYSIATPWTRFYPDALRADLAAQGFQLVTQASEYAHDACGWKTVDTVKKNGWLRGRVSYRHISSGRVEIPHASEKKLPSGTLIPLNPHANRTAAIETGRLVNHVRRNDSVDTFNNTKPILSFNILTQGLNETFDDTSSAIVSRDALPETVVDKHTGEDKPCDTYKCAVLQVLHAIMQVPGVLTLITDDRIEELINNARVADEKLAPLLSKANSNDDDEDKSCDTSQCALLKTLREIFQIPGAVALLNPDDVEGTFSEAQTADESLVALIKDLPLPDNEYTEYGDPPYLRVHPYSGNLAYWDMVKKNVDKFFAEPPSTDPNELDLHLHIPEESIDEPASLPSPSTSSISAQEPNYAPNTMAEKHPSPSELRDPSNAPPTLLRRQDPSPSNETLSLIHKTLLTNSPEADILYMLLEIGAPIIGVVAFFTFALLVTRRVADKLYPDPETASERGDIELNPMRKSSSTHSDKTLVDNAPRVVPKVETNRSWCGPGKVRFWRPGAPFGGEQKMSLGEGEGGRSDGGKKWVGWEGKREGRPKVQVQVPLVPVQRQSSSVYSRSMDGVTLYPGRTVEGWGSL